MVMNLLVWLLTKSVGTTFMWRKEANISISNKTFIFHCLFVTSNDLYIHSVDEYPVSFMCSLHLYNDQIVSVLVYGHLRLLRKVFMFWCWYHLFILQVTSFLYVLSIIFRMNINEGLVVGTSILKMWRLRLPWYCCLSFLFGDIIMWYLKVPQNLMNKRIWFSLCQIQDVDDPITDANQGGSSNSLSALDVVEKQLQFQNSYQVLGMVCINDS